MSIRADLRRRAYGRLQGAAVALEDDCDSLDLEQWLTEREEHQVREFIRGQIVKSLRRRSKEQP